MSCDEKWPVQMIVSPEVFKPAKTDSKGRKVGDLWKTPPELYAQLDAEFHFDPFDPCPSNLENLRTYDGKGEWPSWAMMVFMNPPYSNPPPWIAKGVEEQKKGKTIVMLLRVDTSTAWYHDLVVPNITEPPRFIRGRLRFVDPRTGEAPRANFASMVCVFRGKTA